MDMGVTLDYISLIFIREHRCAGPAYMFNVCGINVTGLGWLGSTFDKLQQFV